MHLIYGTSFVVVNLPNTFLLADVTVRLLLGRTLGVPFALL